MSHEEWRRIPWWVQRVYIDGLVEEELLQVGTEEGLAAWEADPLGSGTDSFRDSGLTVIQGG